MLYKLRLPIYLQPLHQPQHEQLTRTRMLELRDYETRSIPDMTLLTLCYYHRDYHQETRLNAMKSFFLSFQPMIPPKRFDMFSPCLGDAQKVWMRSDFSLNNLCDFILFCFYFCHCFYCFLPKM